MNQDIQKRPQNIKSIKYLTAQFVDGGIRLFFPKRKPQWSRQLTSINFQKGKYLLVILDHLGDAVMATPAISALKSFFPDCSLTVLTRPMNVPVFTNNPQVESNLDG